MNFFKKLSALGGGANHSYDESPANYHHIVDVNGKKKIVDDMTLDNITDNINSVNDQIGQNRGDWVEYCLTYSRWLSAWAGASALTLGSSVISLVTHAPQTALPMIALYGVFTGVCGVCALRSKKQMQEFDEEYDKLVEYRNNEANKYEVQQQIIANNLQSIEKSHEINPYR